MAGPGDRDKESPQAALARAAIEAWIRDRRKLSEREARF
jgi:hypothetical protein